MQALVMDCNQRKIQQPRRFPSTEQTLGPAAPVALSRLTQFRIFLSSPCSLARVGGMDAVELSCLANRTTTRNGTRPVAPSVDAGRASSRVR